MIEFTHLFGEFFCLVAGTMVAAIIVFFMGQFLYRSGRDFILTQKRWYKQYKKHQELLEEYFHEKPRYDKWKGAKIEWRVISPGNFWGDYGKIKDLFKIQAIVDENTSTGWRYQVWSCGVMISDVAADLPTAKAVAINAIKVPFTPNVKR